jgi:hypothetical protein
MMHHLQLTNCTQNTVTDFRRVKRVCVKINNEKSEKRGGVKR